MDGKPKIEKGRWVLIYWLDADDEAGWSPHDPDADDVAEFMPEIGMFVSWGSKFLTLARCYNYEADEWRGKGRVPIGMIDSIWELKKGGMMWANRENK